jgi:hypothetical protein
LNNQKNILKISLREEFARLFVISFGAFLFILFFQPFPLGMLDYNDRLLFVTGFGAITFLMACIVLIVLPIVVPKIFSISEWESGPPFFLSFLLLALTATAFAFYIRFVGNVSLSLYIMFKVVLVCLLPLLILVILYKNKSLERIISIIQEQNNYYFSKIREFEKQGEEEEIEIISDNKSDNLRLKFKNIILVKSADNYIEIYYLENSLVAKKLIRSTLKNIELQLAHHKIFIRSHRTSLINMHFIERLVRSYSGFSLKMSFIDDKIPVSRQYLLQIKEAVSTKE